MPKADDITLFASILGVPISYFYISTDNPPCEADEPQKIMPEKESQDVTAAQTCERGILYVDGKAIDTLARQLRDRLYTEFDKTAPEILDDVKETLHQCLRIYEDNRIERKHA